MWCQIFVRKSTAPPRGYFFLPTVAGVGVWTRAVFFGFVLSKASLDSLGTDWKTLTERANLGIFLAPIFTGEWGERVHR